MEAYMQDDYSTAPVYNPSLAAFKGNDFILRSSEIPICSYAKGNEALRCHCLFVHILFFKQGYMKFSCIATIFF